MPTGKNKDLCWIYQFVAAKRILLFSKLNFNYWKNIYLEALLASQIKRKEKINIFNEEKELEIAEKRQKELQKQEQAEQRKLEREIKR